MTRTKSQPGKKTPKRRRQGQPCAARCDRKGLVEHEGVWLCHECYVRHVLTEPEPEAPPDPLELDPHLDDHLVTQAGGGRRVLHKLPDDGQHFDAALGLLEGDFYAGDEA